MGGKRRRLAQKELRDNQDAILERVREYVREVLRLDCLVTGSWSLKTSQEAVHLLEPLGKDFVHIVTDGRRLGGKFGSIPPEDTWDLTPPRNCGSAFVYYADNETIEGIEFPGFPEGFGRLGSEHGENERIVITDMSSNFLGRKENMNKVGVSQTINGFSP